MHNDIGTFHLNNSRYITLIVADVSDVYLYNIPVPV